MSSILLRPPILGQSTVISFAYERAPTQEFPIRQPNPERFSLRSNLSMWMVNSIADNTPPISPR